MFIYPNGYWSNWQRCGTCGGNGINFGMTCGTCNGRGGWYLQPYIPPYRPYTPPQHPGWMPKCTCGQTSICPVHPEGPFQNNITIS